MIQVPSRVSELIQRLEAGDDPTPEELRRVARLQALDIVRAGEDFVRQQSLEDEKRTHELMTTE